MSALEFKSPDDGSVLSFELMPRRYEEVEFAVAVKTASFSGTAPASTYVSGSPSILFREMANEWKGWEGGKVWSDLERRVAFSATCDHLGHISLAVELVGDLYDSRLRVVLRYEAGQLETMANEITKLLG